MARKIGWEVYIIQTKSGKLYTGITTNLDRRFADHQKSQEGARFFAFQVQKASFSESLIQIGRRQRSEKSRR
jgi:putative endonuclease